MPRSVIGRLISGSSTPARAARIARSAGRWAPACAHRRSARSAACRRSGAGRGDSSSSLGGLPASRRCRRRAPRRGPRAGCAAPSGRSPGWPPRTARCAARPSRGRGTRCRRGCARSAAGPARSARGRGRSAGSARAGSAGAAYDACSDSISVRAVNPCAAESNRGRSGPQSVPHASRAAQNTVRQMRNRGVPMNRAMLSEIRPNASSSSCGRRMQRRAAGSSQRGRRDGASSHGPPPGARDVRARWSSAAVALVVGLAPVLGQQVVEHVVDGHHPEQSLLGVDDGQRDAGCSVARHAGHRQQRGVHGDGLDVRVDDRAERARAAASAACRWKCTTPMNRPVGGLQRRRRDAHRDAERGREVLAADEREAPRRSVVSGRHDDRLGRHQAARGVRRRRRAGSATSSASSGSISSSRLRRGPRAAARAGRPRRRAACARARRRRGRRRGPAGSRPGRPRASPRARRRAVVGELLATSSRRWADRSSRASARSAGFRSEYVRDQLLGRLRLAGRGRAR